MVAPPPMVPVPVVALHPIAVPEAPRLGGLRRYDTDEEGDRRESAQYELHRVVPPEVGICKNNPGRRIIPIATSTRGCSVIDAINGCETIEK
jgi:hypothetical protein